MAKQKFVKGIAYKYGVNAFKNGIKAVPAMDKRFLDEVITGLQNGESIKYLKEWSKGWHEENLRRVTN